MKLNKSGLEYVKSLILVDMPPKSLSANKDDWVEGPLDDIASIYNTYLRNSSGLEDYKDKPIILYCNTGNRSGKAAEILANNGFTDVTNAQGVKEYEYDLVHYKEVRGAAFQEMIDENKDLILVDVRPEKQVKEEGMIEGAINVPFDAVKENLDKLPKEKTIALYCNTGTKSSEVAMQLEGLGYENVINAIEGVKEYSFILVK
ncbi:rhodanese-like domain-containing protein [Cytobacillus solani]|uniref:rhodanese-like domain-containing protein n=1 Tax=Cytobacillus solani TaxID=1637975 RepID=UPI0007001AC9|nr:rhodanese-like domain-containing protein [Cytobacillus solani]